MTPCATCQLLADEVEILSPGTLRDIAASIAPYVDDGRLQQVTGTGSLHDLAKETWPADLVFYVLRCVTCEEGYELIAETYHGRGGHWRRTRPRRGDVPLVPRST